MARFVKEGKEIFDNQLGRYLTSTEAWQLRKSLQLKRLKRELPKTQAEGREDHAMMQKMMNELVQSGRIPNRRYSYEEMHQILDTMKEQRKAKTQQLQRQREREKPDYGLYFVVGVILLVVFFIYYSIKGGS